MRSPRNDDRPARGARNVGRIHAKELPQGRAGVAAAETVGAQRHELAARGHVGSDAFGHGAHVIGGSHHRAPALLQQSAELGTSLSHALRVYSEEMRSKRLGRAEEKAYALPSKLVVPLTVFVFPVLIVVLLYPAGVRVMSGMAT